MTTNLQQRFEEKFSGFSPADLDYIESFVKAELESLADLVEENRFGSNLRDNVLHDGGLSSAAAIIRNRAGEISG